MYRKWAWVALALVTYAIQFGVFQAELLFKFVDGDQMVEADIAARIAELQLPEPYFWGQAYNFPIESWLAAPLLFLGVRADIAILIVAGILCYAPFLLAQLTMKNPKVPTRLLLLSVPILMSPTWWAVTLLPHQYGPRAGLAALCILALYSNWATGFKLIPAFVLGVALASTPTLLLLAPSMAWLPFTIRRWILVLGSVSLGYGTVTALGLFYQTNPEFVVHPMSTGSLSISAFLETWSSVDVRPVGTEMMVFALTVLVLALIAPGYRQASTLRPGSRIRLWTFILGTVFVALAFLAMPKILDFSSSFVFSFYRFWTAIPFLLALVSVFWSEQSDLRSGNVMSSLKPLKLETPIFFIASALTGSLLLVQAATLRDSASAIASAPGPVFVAEREWAIGTCSEMARLKPIDSSIVLLESRNDILAYGCKSLSGTEVLNPEYERRTWLAARMRLSGSSVFIFGQ